MKGFAAVMRDSTKRVEEVRMLRQQLDNATSLAGSR